MLIPLHFKGSKSEEIIETNTALMWQKQSKISCPWKAFTPEMRKLKCENIICHVNLGRGITVDVDIPRCLLGARTGELHITGVCVSVSPWPVWSGQMVQKSTNKVKRVYWGWECVDGGWCTTAPCWGTTNVTLLRMTWRHNASFCSQNARYVVE